MVTMGTLCMKWMQGDEKREMCAKLKEWTLWRPFSQCHSPNRCRRLLIYPMENKMVKLFWMTVICFLFATSLESHVSGHAFVRFNLYSGNFWCGWKILLWFKRCVTWTPNELLYLNNMKDMFICDVKWQVSMPSTWFLSNRPSARKFSFRISKAFNPLFISCTYQFPVRSLQSAIEFFGREMFL